MSDCGENLIVSEFIVEGDGPYTTIKLVRTYRSTREVEEKREKELLEGLENE